MVCSPSAPNRLPTAPNREGSDCRTLTMLRSGFDVVTNAFITNRAPLLRLTMGVKATLRTWPVSKVNWVVIRSAALRGI